MKVLIPILIGLLVVGCGEVENGAYKHRPKQLDTNESTPTTNTNKVNGTTAKPVKELTLEEKVVGTYEVSVGEDTMGMVFLENGIVEEYENGKKEEEEGNWKITAQGEIHLTHPEGENFLLRINPDGSITIVSTKNRQLTLKKIK